MKGAGRVKGADRVKAVLAGAHLEVVIAVAAGRSLRERSGVELARALRLGGAPAAARAGARASTRPEQTSVHFTPECFLERSRRGACADVVTPAQLHKIPCWPTSLSSIKEELVAGARSRLVSAVETRMLCRARARGADRIASAVQHSVSAEPHASGTRSGQLCQGSDSRLVRPIRASVTTLG